MKKGYIRLLVFEFLIGIVLFLNSFVWNILSRHTMNIFLILLLILFKIFFGFEKDRHRYIKDVLMEIIIFLLIYFMLYYLLGIIISFTKPGNYYNIRGLKEFIIPTIVLVVLKEHLRYYILCKSEGSKIAITTCIIIFIWIDITSAIFYGKFNSNYNIFIFLALSLLPAISNNLSFSYITMKAGCKPVILYSLIMSTYNYLLPIVPNPNEYLASTINLIVPLSLCYRIYKFLKKERDEEVDRNYKKNNYFWLIISTIIVITLVYITSGYFHYWAIAVASGSMSPNINKGDVVIIEKKEKDYSTIKKGDVLAFKYDKVTMVHRIVNIIKSEGKYYFYTKGDANNHEDNFVIEEHMIIGTVNIKIPFIGIPTVWLNEL